MAPLVFGKGQLVNERDREILQRVTGSDSIPPEVSRLYDDTLRAWHSIASGPLEPQVLCLIVALSKAMPKRVDRVSPWDNVPANSHVIVREIGGGSYQAVLLRQCHGGMEGQLEVAMNGDMGCIRRVLEEACIPIDVPLVTARVPQSAPEPIPPVPPVLMPQTDAMLENPFGSDQDSDVPFAVDPTPTLTVGCKVFVAEPGTKMLEGIVESFDEMNVMVRFGKSKTARAVEADYVAIVS